MEKSVEIYNKDRENNLSSNFCECCEFEKGLVTALSSSNLINQPFSEAGAKIAVTTAMDTLIEFYNLYDKSYINVVWLRKNIEILKKNIVINWRKVVIEDYIHKNGKIEEENNEDIIKKYGVSLQACMVCNEIIVVVNVGSGDVFRINNNYDYESLFEEQVNINIYNGILMSSEEAWKYVKLKIIKINKDFMIPKAIILSSQGMIDVFKSKHEYQSNMEKIIKIVEDEGVIKINDYIEKLYSRLDVFHRVKNNLSLAVLLFDNIEEIFCSRGYSPLYEDSNEYKYYCWWADAEFRALLNRLVKDNEFFKKYEKIMFNRDIYYGKGNLCNLNIKSNIAYALCRLGRYEKALKIYEEIYDMKMEEFWWEEPEFMKLDKENIDYVKKKITYSNNSK